ncbi:MAG: hypothetical protein P8X55_02740 [Desulfosarcinaceae bacterium]
MKRNPFKFHYLFRFEDGRIIEYPIVLDSETLSLLPGDNRPKPPEWTGLSYQQCEGCPLSKDTHPQCPIALNLMELVETFKDVFSYHDCEVTCKSAERDYVKKTSVMEGLSAIFGVIMATSDCPVMEFLKPMARFHLPFATIEETTVRTASMFLLAQYFKSKDQQGITCDFSTLEKHYTRVQKVNEGLLQRINSISSEDADKNAIITLHSLSQFLSMEIDYSLSSLEYIFSGRYVL